MKNNNKLGFWAGIKAGKYYQTVDESFRRTWKNKTIWFWGLFISSGMSFNFGGNDSSEVFPVGKGSAEEFFLSNWQWLIVGVFLLIVLFLIAWVISGVARSGVIKELNEKQNKKNHKLGFKKIWSIGKKDFMKILGLDLAIIGIVLVVLAIDAIVFLLASVTSSVALMIFVVIVLGVASILLFMILGILKPFALIKIILSNSTFKNSFISSWELIKGNFKEFFKLILTLIVIGFIGGIAFVLVVVPGGLALGLLYGIFESVKAEISALLIALAVIIGGMSLFLVLAFRGFVSLWRMDILIWWVKMVDGVKSDKEVVEEVTTSKKKVAEKKVAVGAGV